MKKISLIFLTLSISFAPNTVFADYGKDAYDFGMQFASSGSYKEAINFFKECAESNYIKKGECAFNVGYLISRLYTPRDYNQEIKWLELSKMYGYEDDQTEPMLQDSKAALAQIKADAKKQADAKKKAEEKRIADAKKAEEKRIADAKKAEEIAEEKRLADAKKAEEADKENGPFAQQITQIAEGNYSSLMDGSFVKNPKNLPICQPSLQEIDFDSQVWDKCWGIQTWSGDRQSQQCVGNCPITRVFEGEYHDFKWSGLGINYYPESIWITIMKNGGWGKTAWGIEGWGFEQRSECKLLGSKVVDDAWVDGEKTDCPGIRELSAIFPTFDCTKSYPFKCDLNVSENFLTTPVGKEYVATSSASVREQPFNDSKLVKTIPKGMTVFVISKTETNDWYLIKEIRDNGFGEDIGQKLGYSPVEFFLSMDEITSNNNSTYSDSPGNLLIDAYIYYMVIKNMHSMREGYAVVYINDSQMKKVKNQMIEIEKILVNKFSLDEDLLWDTAMSKYDQDYSILDLMESTGIYTEDGNRVGMIALLSFGNVADEVLESSSMKDF